MSYFAATELEGDVWQVPDGWQQGRGAWGGLVVAAAIRHGQRFADDRAIRSVTSHMMAPVPVGPTYVSTEVLRAGSGMSTLRTVMTDAAGELYVDTVSIWGFDRALDIDPPYEVWGIAGMPHAPTWMDVPVAPVAPPMGPVFAQNLEYRPVEGFPMSGTARNVGWIGLPHAPTAWDGAHLLGLIDAWWPGAISRASTIHPMATVAFSAQLLVDPVTVNPAEPLLHESWISRASGGYVAEIRRLWTPDGRLAVENLQAIAIIR